MTSVKTTLTQRRSRVNRNEHRDWCAICKLTGGPGEERNTESGTRRIRRRSRPRKVRRGDALQRETSSRRKSSRTSLHEDKSVLKHIMRKCKIVNYVDKETSSGTQISSRRRSSRTTPARLHRTCTVGEAQHEPRGAHEEQHCRSPHETSGWIGRSQGNLDFGSWMVRMVTTESF